MTEAETARSGSLVRYLGPSIGVSNIVNHPHLIFSNWKCAVKFATYSE